MQRKFKLIGNVLHSVNVEMYKKNNFFLSNSICTLNSAYIQE